MQAPVVDLYAVAYEAPKETLRFLESLEHVSVPFSLTVTDNASPNSEVREILQGLPFANVKALPMCTNAEVILNMENVGYAKAINHMSVVGVAPYLAALNCDIEFLRGVDVVGDIAAFFDANPNVGIVGPRTVDEHNRLTHGAIIATGIASEQHRFWMHLDQGQASDVLSVPTVSGATYFARRSMWNELTRCADFQKVAAGAEGAFLPTAHFYEETWCSYHARAHEWEVVYLGTTSMRHLWHRSSPQGSKDMLGPQTYFRQACREHGIPTE